VTEPYVKLVNIFSSAYDNFIATARTCYSSKGIVSVQEVTGPPEQAESELQRRRERKLTLAQSLFKAGHHTTLQHTHVQFALDRVSRHFIWSFLHAHPFYNSEQVSQRYVEVKEDNFYEPDGLTERQREIYLRAVRGQMCGYHELTEKLKQHVSNEYFGRFNGRFGSKRADVDIKKKSQEVARYVLPIATHAYLYHTISLITLLRYYRAAEQFDLPTEQRRVVEAMIHALLESEPEFASIIQQPLALSESPEFSFFADRDMHAVDKGNAATFTAEFDNELNGATSILVDWGARNEQVLAASIREVLGLPLHHLSDAEAINLVLDPSKNHLLGQSMNLTTLSKLNRTMFHPRYAFRKKLSHAADSQDQRHRLSPGSRPVLMRHYTGKPDYITPPIIARDAELTGQYNAIMNETWGAINDLLDSGASPEAASYLLPNAFPIRFTESSDLLNLHHKMAMRLCYNAQDEIWRASREEAVAIAKVNPTIGRWLLPPCALRKSAGQKPFCPEGDRYCGVPVWRLNIADYQRVI
jgi:thymidylate synthase ThyX